MNPTRTEVLRLEAEAKRSEPTLLRFTPEFVKALQANTAATADNPLTKAPE